MAKIVGDSEMVDFVGLLFFIKHVLHVDPGNFFVRLFM